MTDMSRQTPSGHGHGSQPAETRPLLSGPATTSTSTSPPTPYGTVPHLRTSQDTLDGPLDMALHVKLAAAMSAFITLGLIVSTTGVMVPHLERHYALTDLHVSFIFVAQPVGYVLALNLNGPLHHFFGQRGIALFAPACQFIFTLTAALHPPFPVFLVAMAIGFLGGGLLDGSLSAWSGSLPGNANAVQGLIHGCWAVGAGLGPFLAGSIIHAGNPWYTWYYVLAVTAVLQLVALFVAFRYDDGKRYRESKESATAEAVAAATEEADDDDDGATSSNSYLSSSILSYRVTWICALFFLSYVGIEQSISGWIVTYMLRARNASDYLASLCATAFFVGMMVGRMSLGLVSDRVGVRPAVVGYIAAAVVCQITFALAGGLPAIVSACLVALLGVFLGPLFPSGIVLLTKLLPRHLHVSAVSLVIATGQVGGASLPFALGALVQLLGIRIFQIIVVAQLFITLLVWLAFPRLPANSHYEGYHAVSGDDRDEEQRADGALEAR